MGKLFILKVIGKPTTPPMITSKPVKKEYQKECKQSEIKKEIGRPLTVNIATNKNSPFYYNKVQRSFADKFFN